MECSYKLVVAEDPGVLEKKVNNCLDAGFIPVGGLVVNGCKLIQAMTFNVNPEINVHAQVQNNY
jgi:hypothetical protein